MMWTLWRRSTTSAWTGPRRRPLRDLRRHRCAHPARQVLDDLRGRGVRRGGRGLDAERPRAGARGGGDAPPAPALHPDDRARGRRRLRAHGAQLRRGRGGPAPARDGRHRRRLGPFDARARGHGADRRSNVGPDNSGRATSGSLDHQDGPPKARGSSEDRLAGGEVSRWDRPSSRESAARADRAQEHFPCPRPQNSKPQAGARA
jgi:hypothetical protein